MEWRQPYRGIVRHVIPFVEERWEGMARRGSVDRFAAPKLGTYQGTAEAGECVWCGRPAPTKRKYWHSDCFKLYTLFHGQFMSMGRPVVRVRDMDEGRCAVCGKRGYEDGDFADFDEWMAVGDRQIDHKLALGVAGRIDPRAFVRAFLPSNLQVLHRKCHAAKTARDRRAMAALDDPVRFLASLPGLATAAEDARVHQVGMFR